MNQLFEKAHTLAYMLFNKAFAIIGLIVLMHIYSNLPADQPTPYAELLYAVILAILVLVVAPVLRFLIFPEAAEYAEKGQLRKDLADDGNTQQIRHYRFATAISFAITALCVARLL